MKFLVHLLMLMLVITLSSCTEDPDSIADFTFQDRVTLKPLATSTHMMGTYDEVGLVNQSTDVKEVHWDFGDGNSSSDHDAIASYKKSGTYPVIMTVTHKDGTQSRARRTIVVKDRALKSIEIRMVQWNPGSNGWPPNSPVSIFFRMQDYTDADMDDGYLCTTCPVIYTSPMIKNVYNPTYTHMFIPVTEKVVIDKKKVGERSATLLAEPINLNKAYLLSLMARDKDGKEYCLTSNRGGGVGFGIDRENFSANEFIVHNTFFSDYLLNCEFE